MFDPKSVTAYQSIKAPERLRERVLTARPKRRLSPVFGGGLIAAGLAVLFLSVSFFSSASVGITVGGIAVSEQATVLPTEATAPMMARMGVATTNAVSFDTDTTILSADGMLTDAEYQKLDLPYELPAGETILWHAQTPPNTFTMTVQADREETVLKLTYEETKNHWTVYRQ